LPEHCGVQPPETHWPLALHESPWAQAPHEPPQLSEPHCLPEHWGVQVPWHFPAVQDCPSPHAAQAAPLAPQAGALFPASQAPLELTQPAQPPVLMQLPAVHSCCPEQIWQAAPLKPHAATVFAGLMQVPLMAQHPLAQFEALQLAVPPSQTPDALQLWVPVQAAQATPPAPHAEAPVPSRH
jgi:hypothetical protein